MKFSAMTFLSFTLPVSFSLMYVNLAQGVTIDAMKHAEQLFAAAKYEDAAGWYKTELSKNSSNCSAHYMLGVCFAKLNRNTEAVQEFKLAKETDKSGIISGYSERYLQSLNRENLQAPGSAQSTSQSTAPQAAYDGDESPNGSAPKATSEKIGKNTNSASAALEAECAKEVERIDNDANQKIQSLTTKMEKSLAEVPRSLYRNTGSYYQDQAIKAEFQQSVQGVRDEAARKEAEIKAHYRARQTAVEDSASAMHRSYQSKNQVGKIILSPVGTNMNVRNYQTADEPSGNDIPVVAAPAKPLPPRKN